MNRLLYRTSSEEMEPKKKTVDVTVSLTISKTLSVEVSDDDSLEDAVLDSYVLPSSLAAHIKDTFANDLELKAVGMSWGLKNAVEDCSDWNIDELLVVEE